MSFLGNQWDRFYPEQAPVRGIEHHSYERIIWYLTMDPILAIAVGIPLVAAALLTAGFLISSHATRGPLRAWGEAAQRLGMVNPALDSGMTFSLYLGGALNGGTLIVHYDHFGQEGPHTYFSYNANGTLSAGISINEPIQGFSPTPQQNLFQIGEPQFDKDLKIWGDSVELFAIFDADTRAHALGLVPHGLSVFGDTVHLVMRHKIVDTNELVDVVESLTTFSQRLGAPKDLKERLAHNATSDPTPGVRQRNLEFLIWKYYQDPLTLKTLRSAMHDSDQGVVVTAAIALGAEGVPTLQAIAANDASPSRYLARAVTVLGPLVSPERAIELVTRGRETGDLVLFRAAIGALGKIGGAKSVALLANYLTDPTPTVAATAAAALGDCGALAETILTGALAYYEREVRVNAATALGKSAGVSAVAPLHEAIKQHTLDFGFRHAAVIAISAIKQRATGAAPGQLALTTDISGAISLADADPSGQVTLAETESKMQRRADSDTGRSQKTAPKLLTHQKP